jgi:hypothetical protein
MMRKSPFLTRELYAAVAALKVWLMAGELVAGQLGGAGEVSRAVLCTALQHIVLKCVGRTFNFAERINKNNSTLNNRYKI